MAITGPRTRRKKKDGMSASLSGGARMKRASRIYRRKAMVSSVGRECVGMFISTPPPVVSEIRAPNGPPLRRSGGGAGERRCIKTGKAGVVGSQGAVNPCGSERKQNKSRAVAQGACRCGFVP